MPEIKSGKQSVIAVAHGQGRAPTQVTFSNGATAKIWKNQWEGFTSPKMDVGEEADLVLETKPDARGNTETWVVAWGGTKPASGGGGGAGGAKKWGGGGGGITDQAHIIGTAMNNATALAIASAGGKPIKAETFIKAYMEPLVAFAKTVSAANTAEQEQPKTEAPATTEAPAEEKKKDDTYDPFAED